MKFYKIEKQTIFLKRFQEYDKIFIKIYKKD